MNGVAVYGWGLPSMDSRPIGDRKTVHETYGRLPWKGLPSMEIPPIHGWEGSMSGMQHIHVLAFVPTGNVLEQYRRVGIGEIIRADWFDNSHTRTFKII